MKMTTLRRVWVPVFLLLLTGLLTQPVFGDEGDPPGRVARLSLAEGKVSLQPAGETEWSEASVNRPITTGDRLYTDQSSRAELEAGPFAVRFSQTTDVTLVNLNDQLMQLGIGQGTIRVAIYELPPNNTVEIDTPNGALTLQKAGNYRVDIAPDGSSTQVAVNAGSLELTGGGLNQTLDDGQAVQLSGTGPIQVATVSIPEPDDFDKWCQQRDRRIQDAASVKYVSPSVPGCEDLDTYGRWEVEPDYGPVWYPASVPPGWIPYRFGHWAFIEPWGWTWVEDEPWGYAPFHYGRWAFIGPGWAWVPGPVVVRPVFAPALVAFVGGPGFAVGIGVGGLAVQAWFPLGPREPFLPWYHYGPTYLRTVNVVEVTNITNIHYVNREAAVTAVPGEVFRGGGRVAGHVVAVGRDQLAQAEIIPHPGIAPTSRAVFGGKNVEAPPVRAEKFGAPGGEGTPHGIETGSQIARPEPGSMSAVNRPNAGGGPPTTPFPHMFSRNPPPAGTVPFSARAPAYSDHPGRPLEPQQMNNLRAGKPAGPMKDKEVPSHSSKESHSSSHEGGHEHK